MIKKTLLVPDILIYKSPLAAPRYWMWPLIAGMAKPITLSHRVRSGGWESMISANGGLPAHRYTPQVTPRWPRVSEPASLDECLQWSHLSSGHTGANRSVNFFRECFYSSLTLTELRSRMQTIVDACGCHASKQSDSRDRGLISSLPIPYCANSLLYVDFIHGLPRFGGYDSCLVVTCGLSRFTRVFPCKGKSQVSRL